MKSIVISTIFLIVLSSCNENDCCSSIPGNDAIFEFSVMDSEGTDLLDPATPENLNTPDIRLYNEVDGEASLIYDKNLDAPYGFNIIEWESIYRIRPFFDLSDGLVVKGYLQWNSQDTDTIKLELIQQSENVKRLKKVYYNDTEVWNEETVPDPDYRYFQIIK